jgi:conjugative transfer pilus assembly protein TraH
MSFSPQSTVDRRASSGGAMPSLHRFAAVFMMCAPFVAQAGVLTDMTNLIMSNSSSPSTLATKDRVGVFGGSYELRAPVTSVNLVSFDPPRADAGCGGIDLYAGSFSFINSQQLVQVFRAVAQNSIGLAFKAAIMYISPGLDKLITEFQTVMQDMNKLAKNSCQLAHLIVDPSERALGMQVNADGSIASADTGLFSDQFSTLTGYLSSADSYLKKAGATNPSVGNLPYKAIMNSGVAASLGLPGLGNADGSADNPSDPNTLNNRVLISFMGYEVTGLPCSHQNQAGTSDSTTAGPNATLTTVACTGAPTLTLQDLVEGGGAGSWNPNTPLLLYQCLNPNGTDTGAPGAVDPQICTSMQTVNYNYPGIRAYVNIMLYGNPDPAMGITSTSMLGQMNAGASVNMTPEQIKFLNTLGIPLVGLLSKTSNLSVRTAITQRLADHIVTCAAAGVGTGIWKSLTASQTGGQNNLSDTAKANVERLRKDVLRFQDTCANDHRVLDIASELEASLHLPSNNAR